MNRLQPPPPPQQGASRSPSHRQGPQAESARALERALAAPNANAPLTDRDVAALLLRIGNGDEAAVDELWRATSARVLGLTLRVLGDRGAAEEALLDTFVQVWRQGARFDPQRGSAIAWLLLLARTRAIDARRGRLRLAAREAEAPDGSRHDAAPADIGEARSLAGSPAEALSLEERAARVRAAMRELPEAQRVLVEASFFGGMSHGEIAAAAKLPLGTVKTRIRSGLAALRLRLAAIREDDDDAR